MTDIVDGEAVEEHDPLPAVRPAAESAALVVRDQIGVAELMQQANLIEEVMRVAMKPDIHYGRIPGVDKPTLLKPGAEKLNVLFRLAPEYDSEKIWHDDGHLTVISKCRLRHIPTGYLIAEGEGLCSTKEAKYAYRQGGRVCPECGRDAIIKGKEEYGGGWLCFKRKGGCGAKFADGTQPAKEFETAVVGRVPNEDLPDSFNTVVKMSNKRSLLAAVLNGTAASDIFTQDVGDDDTASAEPAVDVPPPGPYDFDPATNLLPDAPTGQHTADEGMTLLAQVHPLIEWPKVIKQATEACFGVTEFKQIPKEKTTEFWTRFANACRRMHEEAMAADPNQLPPLSEDEMKRVFAWAFGGAAFDFTYREMKEKNDDKERP